MGFSGIEIGSSALKAQQLAIERTGHNIANVNSEGYSRQVVQVSPSVISGVTRYDSPVFGSGTGVNIDEVKRYRDSYLDYSYRTENHKLGEVSVKEDYLTNVELLFNTDLTPGSVNTGLREKFDIFFNSLQDITNNPSDISKRQKAIDEAVRLTDHFHQIKDGLDNINDRINQDMNGTIKEINEIASRVADLNNKITLLSSKGGGGHAGLLDERDKALDRLSELISFKSFENPETGSLTIYAGSSPLVSDNTALPLNIDNEGNIRYKLSNRIAYGFDNGRKIDEIEGGKLDALLELRDITLPGYSEQLDREAETLVENVNKIHKNGYDLNGNRGTTFFTDFENMNGIPPVTNNSGNIKVSNELLSNPQRLAVSVADLTSNYQMARPEKEINRSVPLNEIPSDTFIVSPDNSGTVRIAYYDDTGSLVSRDINWDNSQSLDEIVSNINSSFYGIATSFDSVTQKLTLTRESSTGNGPEIRVVDPSFIPPSTQPVPGAVYIQDTSGNFITGFASLPDGCISAPSQGNSLNALKLSDIGEINTTGNQFVKSEIIDWQQLMTSLQSPLPGSPEERIFNSLDLPARNIISSWTSGTTLKDSEAAVVINGLNEIIKSDNFYDTSIFSSTLSSEGEELKNNYPQISHFEMERLNRLLMENTWQGEVKTSNVASITDDYTSMLSKIGINLQNAEEFKEVYTLSTEQFLNLRESVSGVSLDEEFANLIKYQKAFEAAARFISVSDQMLDTIVNGLGI